MPVDDLKPLTARSVVFSLLLGSHPDRMSPAQVTSAGEHFGIPAATLRVALTRAVAAGDLRRLDPATGSGEPAYYALGERLVARQRRQDEGVEDAETSWDGTWEMAVVVVTGRSGSDRATLREALGAARLAELREGVWTRPANLRRAPSYGDPVLTTFRARPDDDPIRLAHDLWDLRAWGTQGRRLLDLLASTADPAPRLAIAAHVVRHLTADPLLPHELLPADWPGSELRAAYADYQAELRALAVV